MRLLKKGDRIRLKVRTMAGWKGLGTVSADQHPYNDTIVFFRDGKSPIYDRCIAARREVALVRKETR
jgi:hypothetical protein